MATRKKTGPRGSRKRKICCLLQRNCKILQWQPPWEAVAGMFRVVKALLKAPRTELKKLKKALRLAFPASPPVRYRNTN